MALAIDLYFAEMYIFFRTNTALKYKLAIDVNWISNVNSIWNSNLALEIK